MTQHIPRLHLVAPNGPVERIAACAGAACAAGDVASILLPPLPVKSLVERLQRLGLAVLSAGDPQSALSAGADGSEVSDLAAYQHARSILGADRIVGAFCAASRHRAMELGEAGADYVAFAQRGHEDLISWWAEIFQPPCIAADPVTPESLDILLPHRPDFIRPDDAMWDTPEMAHDVVARLTARLKG